jgi:hypothetical protein
MVLAFVIKKKTPIYASETYIARLRGDNRAEGVRGCMFQIQQMMPHPLLFFA